MPLLAFLAIGGVLGALILFSSRASAATVKNPPSSQNARFDRDNVSAFLALIRRADGGDVGAYNVVFGGGTFTDFSNHPYETGEWKGVRHNGRLTTAAGAYQITVTTWRELGGVARFGDFSPEAQDQAALAILREKRPAAIGHIEAGRFDLAIATLRNEWEAFAKMLDGQYPFTLSDAREFYREQGGTFA